MPSADVHRMLAEQFGRGWRSRFHNEALVYGIAPRNLEQFLLQRHRWAAGNLATVQGWRRTDDWAMNSTHQSNVNFSSKGLESLLEMKKNFLPDVKKK